eukprot:m.72706 g.72706  ORF g.72706 m.72706 type:complete len:382 (+) comp12350_c0_seq1:311-1456(+)
MAESRYSQSAALTRAASARRVGTSSRGNLQARPVKTAPSYGRKQASDMSTKSKKSRTKKAETEEDYLRINEELERKTAGLFLEVDDMMKKQDDLLLDTTDRNSAEGLEDDFNYGDESSDGLFSDENENANFAVELETDIRRSLSASPLKLALETEAVQEQIAQIDTGGDVVLEAALAGDMGEEATVRLLKAKLKVMQNEIAQLTEELKDNKGKSKSYQTELKSINAMKGKFEKKAKSAENELSRARAALDETKTKLQAETAKNRQVMKELEELKRDHKKSDGRQSALEVRLQRAQEENDGLRLELQNARKSGSSADSRGKMAELETKIAKLQQQKKELINAFKKQAQLVDVLKRQKLHIEATRMLQFTEEEFVSAMRQPLT